MLLQKLSFARTKRKKTIALFEQIIHLQALNLPLQVCLERILQIQKSPELEQVLVELDHGLDLNQALATVEEQFDPLGLELLKLAVQSQTPEKGLRLYLEQARLQDQLKKSLGQALFYPSILLSLSLGLILIFQTQVLPAYQHLGQAFDLNNQTSQLGPSLPVIFISLGLFIGLISHKNLRNKLPGFRQFQIHLDWLSWLQIMRVAGESGLNFSNALNFSRPYVQHLSNYPWHIELQQELAFGNAKLSVPTNIPKATKNILELTQVSPDWQTIFGQAACVLQSEIETKLMHIERYLQPLLLVLITFICGYLAKLIYSPLIQLGNVIL